MIDMLGQIVFWCIALAAVAVFVLAMVHWWRDSGANDRGYRGSVSTALAAGLPVSGFTLCRQLVEALGLEDRRVRRVMVDAPFDAVATVTVEELITNEAGESVAYVMHDYELRDRDEASGVPADDEAA